MKIIEKIFLRYKIYQFFPKEFALKTTLYLKKFI